MKAIAPLACLALLVTLTTGCEDKPSENAAPTSSSLAAPEKATAAAQTFEIKPDSSKVTFLMDAPLEKIHGDAPKSVSGEFSVDPTDLAKTTGLIKVDLKQLTLYQQKREDEKGEYGERTKSDRQNEHAQAWLEIGEDTPPDAMKKNRYVEFQITGLSDVSQNDLTKLTGTERKVTATAKGKLRLHQRAVDSQAKLEATFKYQGDKLTSVTVKTTAPINVDLEAHDVRPREAFGKLAQKTLGALAPKVAKQAPIQLEATATVK